MDFTFVGFPVQQEYLTILKIPLRSLICTIESCISTTVLVQQHCFVNDDTAQKCILRLNCCFYLRICTCMHVSSTALLWDASLQIMENDDIWGAIVTYLCHDSSAVDSRRWSRNDQKTVNPFLRKAKILCWVDHTFSIWLIWFTELLCFTIRTTVETRMTDKSECQNCSC
jgi:hypothetical protein